jgi:hypothetical protein
MDDVSKNNKPRGGGPSSKKVAGLIILAMVLCGMYIHNIHVDAKREAELDAFMAKNGPNGVHIGNHAYIESLKVSRTKKTNAAVLLGFIRGAIIGTVLGGDAGSLEGMVSFGVLNGILFWVNEHLAEFV